MEREIFLTRKGLKRLKEKYQKLNKRLRSSGEEQDLGSPLRQKVGNLRKILDRSRLIKPPPKSQQKKVALGATVKVEREGDVDEFQIVDSIEANPQAGKISKESLAGKALLGHKVGDKVVVQSQVKITYKILDINY